MTLSLHFDKGTIQLQGMAGKYMQHLDGIFWDERTEGVMLQLPGSGIAGKAGSKALHRMLYRVQRSQHIFKRGYLC